MSQQLETATLAAGCFWCVEAPLQQLEGIEKVVSGYTGGSDPNPTYRAICTGTTGHAEVVQVTFDPNVISFHDLLEIFFTIHDPTTLNRQGADVGTQYRSGIFYHTPEQKKIAEEVIAEFNAKQIWPNPIVTEVVPLVKFFPAEDYHQNYFNNQPMQPYCQAVVAPKVLKVRQKYAQRLRK
jgi:peptide-methionine (S)-S-oxide reductase